MFNFLKSKILYFLYLTSCCLFDLSKLSCTFIQKYSVLAVLYNYLHLNFLKYASVFIYDVDFVECQRTITHS